ncbi:transcription initiation factor iif subunit [Nannochloropsis oceanica]
MLDTTRQGVRVWLVKVPVAVAEAIKNAQEGDKIGTLTVSRSNGSGGSGGGGQELRTEAVRLEESLCERLELPRDFSLEAPPPDTRMPKMYALRAASTERAGKEGGGAGALEGRMMVEGVVSRRTSMLPTASLDYRAFAKKRQIQHHRKERRLELLVGGGERGNGGVRKMIDLNAPLDGGAGGGGGGGGGREGGMKRARLDEAALRTTLFQCFKLKAAWAARELVQRLGQPEGSVKAALREIADYQSQGEHFGKYLLKPAWTGAGLKKG